MTDDNDKALRIYRKLSYFFEHQQAIHFKVESGGDAGYWRNGIILDLSKSKMTLVIKEFVMGERPYLLEELDEDSICAYTIRAEEEK